MNDRLVLCFHGIGEPTQYRDEAERQHWCSQRDFAHILDSLPEVSATAGIPIEITFDDGFVSDIEVAAPLLQARGLTATFFVCVGHFGVPGYMDVNQVRSLAAAGMTIGSHGWHHANWRTLPSDQALHKEVVQARDVIADTVANGPIEAVAIPYGLYDRRVIQAVSRVFSKIYTSDPGLASPDAFTIPRETYLSQRWQPDTLHCLAAPRPGWKIAHQGLINLYKRHRQPLLAG